MANLTPEERAAEHRRQMLLQVWSPLVLSILIIVALGTLTIAGAVLKSSEVNRWGNISTVYLLIPNLIINLIILALMVLVIIGVNKFSKKLPGWLQAAQGFFALIARQTRKIADRVAAPIISVNGAAESIRTLLRLR